MPVRVMLTALLVPPPSLVLLALVGLGVARVRRRLGLAITLVALAGLLVLALPLTGRALLVSLERGLPAGTAGDQPAATPLPQAVVVLGGDAGPVAEGPLADGAGFAVGPLTLQRLAAGALLARRTRLPVLVSGGALRPEEPPLATMMAQAMQAYFGVPVRWAEPRSMDTWQNAAFSTTMLAADGIGTAYVVTHAWHMRRALIAFRHFGLTATPAPIQIDAPPRLTLDAFIPSLAGWRMSYYGLHEWIGCAYYAWR